MTRAIILEGNIKDKLWSELVLTIIYIKNSCLTKTLAINLSLYEAHFHKKSDLLYLQILGHTIYILLYKEKHPIKLKRWALRALKRILVGFNGYTIYKAYIKDQNRVIQLKDL